MRSGIIATFLVVFFAAGSASAEGLILKGTIIDESKQPVAGAELFVYDSPSTKRPADFISAKTKGDGRFSLHIPSGKYWMVARVRQSDKFGPLLPNDRHSGDPQELDLTAAGRDIELTVVDIRDLSRAKEKARSDMTRLSGRIIDKAGRPVTGAYVSAWQEPVTDRLPDAVSGWTDISGEYLLFLPSGDFLISAADRFPPKATGKGFIKLTTSGSEKKVAFDIQLIRIEGLNAPSGAGSSEKDDKHIEDD